MIIWTRSQENWSTDQNILHPYRDQLVRIPCVHREVFAEPSGWHLSLRSESILVFTSAKAVEVSARQPELRDLMEQGKSLCVGPKTLGALRSHGCDGLHPPSVGSAKDLAQYIRSVYPVRENVFVLPGAEERAYDLYSDLQSFGYECLRLNVYKTRTEARWEDGQCVASDSLRREEFVRTANGQVFFCSPSAVKGFIEAFEPSKNCLAKSLQCIAFGESTRRACEGHFEEIVVPPGVLSVEALMASFDPKQGEV
ncbi:MAG: uroporphyrinogen-III synthase [Oligoflexales bacterium]|nr:uroporphyrinogen-III synthase [Oligoflexales bacterium]